ncbi:hypothetical protein [Sphingopyxis sp. BSNA05]|uniref:hypothetical protein n=1 Tax=Sphingopyxis sp. BSNA05 TaxID=1236614 RepID=UPI00156781C5|nr:hypothetical protein [Sphingopyxis sp. BSNA05]
MIAKQSKSGLVTGFRKLADLLASDDMIQSRHQRSSSAKPLSPDAGEAEDEFYGVAVSRRLPRWSVSPPSGFPDPTTA